MNIFNFEPNKDTLFTTSGFDESEYVIIGYPYEGSLSGIKGTAGGADKIYELSYNIEEYSPYQKRSIEELKICVLNTPKINFTGNNFAECLELIYAYTDELRNRKKKILSIGGEHSITFPLFKRHYEEYRDIVLFHFDAHTDLRDDYPPAGSEIPTKYSHASVIKRIYNELDFSDVYQLGIRSGTEVEFDFAEKYLNICPFDTSKMNEYLSCIDKARPVYITIDLDVLDPSVFPGVGTPEPLGISYKNLITELNKFKNYNIVGIDIVEYSPPQDISYYSAHTAIHLIRELFLIWSSY